MQAFKRFLADEGGATAIEYGLMAAMLALAVLISILLLQEPVAGLYGSVHNEFVDVNAKL